MGMNVNLTPQLEAIVQQKISSGLYASASEVVREALRLMSEKDSLHLAKLEQLRADIRAGIESGTSTAFGVTAMPQVTRRPLAAQDIAEIWEFIADDSFEQADAWVDRLEATLKLLATQPKMGRARNDLYLTLRSFPFGRYIVFYSGLADGIDVVRVLHSARDVTSEFERNESPPDV
jgi:toxin ParE1/3/4